MSNKGGVSEVVTTVIMVALAIVAIGVVWVVIQNILSEQGEQIEAGLSRVSLNIESVNVLVDAEGKKSYEKANGRHLPKYFSEF